MSTQALDEIAFRVRLNQPFEEALEQVTNALKAEGFGVLTKIDVKETLKQKLNAEFRNYVILGACHPPLAHRALTTELEIGLLLPCNVIVYEDDGGSVVAITDPKAMLGIVQGDELAAIADDARARLRRVAEALQAG